MSEDQTRLRNLVVLSCPKNVAGFPPGSSLRCARREGVSASPAGTGNWMHLPFSRKVPELPLMKALLRVSQKSARHFFLNIVEFYPTNWQTSGLHPSPLSLPQRGPGPAWNT